MDQLEAAGASRAAIEVGALLVRLRSELLVVTGLELQQLLTDEKARLGTQRDRVGHANKDTVGATLVLDHQVAIFVVEAGMARGEQRVLGKEDRALLAARHVLGGVEVVGDAIHPLTLDQDQLGSVGGLHRAEEEGLGATIFYRFDRVR